MPPLQDRAGQVAVEQQKASRQVSGVGAAAQSPVAAHVCPAVRPVQVPATTLHLLPFTQFASDAHAVRHELPLHAKSPHAVLPPGVHDPVPLQLPIDVAPTPGETQDAAPHDTVAPTF